MSLGPVFRIMIVLGLVSGTAVAQQSPESSRLLLWKMHTQGQTAAAKELATQILAASPADPLSAAISLPTAEMKDKKAFELAQRALEQYAVLSNPGLDARGFYELQRFVAATLSGAVGEGYFERKQYEEARTFLQRAMDVDSQNGRYAYFLGRAYLAGKDPDPDRGYWYLARAANLSRGSPGGEQVAAYARDSYLHDGGTAENWNQFLIATGAPASSVASATVARGESPAPLSSNQQTASTARAPSDRNHPDREATTRGRSEEDIETSARNTPTGPGGVRQDEESQPQSSDRNQDTRTDEEKIAALKARINQPAPSAASATDEKPAAQPGRLGSPVSIGLLIQTDKTEGSSRKVVVNGLTDMVRHLRRTDEAFVLSFGRDMAMEEDLTANSDLLEKAMDEIKGSSGTALYDAVSFSAGHLARIARNSNRALLVISDGSVEHSQVSPLQLSRAIQQSGVRVYCIGLEVSSPADQQRLMALAANTGGQAMFVSNATQFRTAARSIASRLGVPF